jgi:hypothetical protein
MIDNLSLSASEQLCAFLDGELEPTEASSLFFALAQSTELQEEMREHLGIKKLFSKSIYQPPDSLKMSILQTAGLSSAAAPLNNTIDSAGGNGFWIPLLKNRGFLVLSTALVVCLATLFYTNQNGNQGSIASLQSGNQITKEANLIPGNTFQNTNSSMALPRAKHKLPVVSSMAKENEQLSVNQAQIDNTKSALAKNQNLVDDDNSVSTPQNIVTIDNPISKPRNFHPESFRDKLSNFQNFTYNSIYPDLARSSFIDNEIFKKLSLQLRGFTARSIPENQVAPLSQVTLNNIGISLFYQLDENSSAGLEIGQEDILQKFSGVKDDKQSIWDQNWTAFWWGIMYQYTMKNEEEFADLQPFVRGFVGGTRLGPITRGILGLQYTFADRVNMFGGIEGTILFYNFQGTYFTTKKIGITYGFGVKF